MTLSSLKRAIVAMLAMTPALAFASEGGFDGASLALYWAIPFTGILLSIALFPLLAPHFWHHNFGKVALFWAATCAIPMSVVFGGHEAFHQISHILLADYLPFLVFVGTLFVVAGGIHIQGSFVGRPIVNVCFLAIGALLANLMGTTGAAMLLIRPLISANAGRKYKIQTFIFFIFLVANIGGALTPLGDPPLFLGFLKGVSFFWTAQYITAPWLMTVASLLGIYYLLDSYMFKKDVAEGFKAPESTKKFAITGKINIFFLLVIVGAVLLAGFWKTGVEFHFLGVHFPLESLVRDFIFLVVAGLSLRFTSTETREANHFTWDPILEVAKLFFGIFICIVPVLEMLRAGHNGAFSFLVSLVTNDDGTFHNTFFFWLTGILSAFLDNAPTYLAFFNLAGGDPVTLMTVHHQTLEAISMGSVFMGAVSYIGNAPNFMTVAICNERGVKMPTFFGYLLWSVTILFPVFFIVDMIFLT